MPALRRALPFLAAATLLGAGAIAYALTRPKTDAPAKSLVVTPDPIDFGDVPYGEAPEKTIELTNVSTHDIFLRDPHFTCTCFTLMSPVAPQIRAGQTIDFRVRLWSQMGEPGRFHKKLLIATDDPALGALQIPVVGAITDFRSVTPTRVALGAWKAGDDPLEGTIAVRGGSGFVVRVAQARVVDPRLTAEVRAVDGGADVVVRTGASPTKGAISTEVRLDLDVGAAKGGATRRYSQTVPITGEVR